jgi:hypothetical protein
MPKIELDGLPVIDAAEREGCRVRLAARASDSAILLFWKGAGRTICGS